jgi:hypothetical protein
MATAMATETVMSMFWGLGAIDGPSFNSPLSHCLSFDSPLSHKCCELERLCRRV